LPVAPLIKSLTGRFAKQMYFGDTIITKIWKVGDGIAIIQGETEDGTVITCAGMPAN